MSTVAGSLNLLPTNGQFILGLEAAGWEHIHDDKHKAVYRNSENGKKVRVTKRGTEHFAHDAQVQKAADATGMSLLEFFDWCRQVSWEDSAPDAVEEVVESSDEQSAQDLAPAEDSRDEPIEEGPPDPPASIPTPRRKKKKTGAKAGVLAVLTRSGAAMHIDAIYREARKLGYDIREQSVSSAASSLVDDGQAIRPGGRGIYQIHWAAKNPMKPSPKEPVPAVQAEPEVVPEPVPAPTDDLPIALDSDASDNPTTPGSSAEVLSFMFPGESVPKQAALHYARLEEVLVDIYGH